MADLTGRVLSNRYRVEAYVGRGGMAQVYRAVDTRRSYPVALKVLHPELAEDTHFVNRFRAEADNLARLAHENIVRFYSLEQEGALAYLVTDFVDGITLRTLLVQTGGPLPLPHIAHIFPPLCRALHYAHREGVIHRDIKPANIMVQADGRVFVTDFGIAKAADAATLTAPMPGTPAYMAPEQCRNEPADHLSDIYSLGIVLFEMGTGQRPFNGNTATATGNTRDKIRWEQVYAPPPSPTELNPQLPAMLGGIILKAMNKRPDARFSSVPGLLESFEIAAGGITPAVPAVHPAPAAAGPVLPPPAPALTAAGHTPPPARPATSRGLWAVLAAGAIFFLAVGVVGWLALSRLKSPPPVAQEAPATATETATGVLIQQKTCLERGPALVTQAAQVHSGPGKEFGDFAALPAGSEIIVTGQNNKGTWWQIVHPAGPEGHGWIDRDDADTQQDLCPPALTVTLPSPTPPPTAVPVATPTAQTVVIDTLPAAVLNKIAPPTPAKGDTLNLPAPTAVPVATPLPAPTKPPAAPAAPALPPDCPDSRATIIYPRDGDTIRGNVHFLGTADLPNLRKYIIEYRPAGETNWRFLLVKDFTWVKNGDVLFTLVTSTIPAGVYDFRLTVVDMTGNYPDPCEVTVTVRH